MGQGKFELFAEAEASFFARVTELTVTFVKDTDGKVTQLMLTQGGGTRPAKRIE